MLYYRLGPRGTVSYCSSGSCTAAWRYWLDRERENGRLAEVLVLRKLIRFCEEGQAKLVGR